MEWFEGSVHVVDVSLDRATDRKLWDWAGERGFVIITKDSDFRNLASVLGPPPKVIWLRIGNASIRDIGRAIRRNAPRILEFGESEGAVLLEVWATDRRM